MNTRCCQDVVLPWILCCCLHWQIKPIEVLQSFVSRFHNSLPLKSFLQFYFSLSSALLWVTGLKDGTFTLGFFFFFAKLTEKQKVDIQLSQPFFSVKRLPGSDEWRGRRQKKKKKIFFDTVVSEECCCMIQMPNIIFKVLWSVGSTTQNDWIP